MCLECKGAIHWKGPWKFQSCGTNQAPFEETSKREPTHLERKGTITGRLVEDPILLNQASPFEEPNKHEPMSLQCKGTITERLVEGPIMWNQARPFWRTKQVWTNALRIQRNYHWKFCGRSNSAEMQNQARPFSEEPSQTWTNALRMQSNHRMESLVEDESIP